MTDARRGAVDRGDELGRRRVHRLPALDDLRRARALEERAVARARDDRDDLA